MQPNLRRVVAEGWRSIGSRRILCSSRGSNGKEETDLLAAALVQSRETISYAVTGFGIYCFYDFTHLYSLISKRKRRLALIAEEKELKGRKQKDGDRLEIYAHRVLAKGSRKQTGEVTFLGLANKGLSLVGGFALGRLYLKHPGYDLAKEADEDVKRVEERVNALKEGRDPDN